MGVKYVPGMIISYLCTGLCIIAGFYKMFVYENSEFLTDPAKNAYVGGDAYNYIINASYSTAWFVLAGVFAIIGLAFVVAGYLNEEELHKEEIVESSEVDE